MLTTVTENESLIMISKWNTSKRYFNCLAANKVLLFFHHNEVA